MEKIRPVYSTRTLLLIPLLALLWFACSDDGAPTAPVTDDDPPPVTTVDTIPPAGVDELVVKAPGVRSLGLQWIAPGNDGWEGTATEYDIRYSTEPIDDSNWHQAGVLPRIPEPVAGRTVQKCRAITLEPATRYYFAMKTRDQDGNESVLSNVAHGITVQESMPPSPIEDLVVSEIAGGRFLLAWTARGDDGVLGTASKYEIRYSMQNVLTETNWLEGDRVENNIVPGPPGTRESFVVEVPIPERNHSFAVIVGDEVTNWSPVSNYALALGTESYLWVYPQDVHKGDAVSVVFRAPGDQQVDIELFAMVGTCGTGDVSLYSGVPEAGIYTVEFDFYDRDTGKYWNPNWYQISVCINGERRDLNRVQFSL